MISTHTNIEMERDKSITSFLCAIGFFVLTSRISDITLNGFFPFNITNKT